MIRKRSRLRGGDADGQVQTFRSPTAMVVWVVWLLFAAANWIDLAVQHPDHTSAVAAGVLLVGTGVAYAAALRPRIIADTTGITVRNPLRDHAIGWAGVTKVDLADLLRVHCRWDSGPASSVESAESTGSAAPGQRTKVIPAWAVHYSRRRQLAAESRARRASGPRGSAFGFPSVGGVLSGGRGLPSGDRGYPAGGAVATPSASVSAAEADAEMVCRLLNERATAAQAETVWATGTGTQTAAATAWLEPLKSTWSGKAIAAILIPALILLIICLI